jgi:hypothetical protein
VQINSLVISYQNIVFPFPYYLLFNTMEKTNWLKFFFLISTCFKIETKIVHWFTGIIY